MSSQTHDGIAHDVKKRRSLFSLIFHAQEDRFQTMDLFLRAVEESRNHGRPRMLGVGLDGLDDQVEFVGAVDFAGYAVIAVWRDLLGFGEVMQAIDPVRGVISHNEHGTGAVFRPGDQSEMIGAEVEHKWMGVGRKGPAQRQRR